MEAMEAKVVAGATIDAESHPTSGHVSSKSALAGSRILNNINRHICGTLHLCPLWMLRSTKLQEQCLHTMFLSS